MDDQPQPKVVIQSVIRDEVKDYKKFVFSKDLIDLAVALILATATQKIVASISDHLFMPIINFFVNRTGGEWRSLCLTPWPGMVIETGALCGGLLEFIVTTVVLYVMYIKIIRGWIAPDPPPPPSPVSSPHRRRKRKKKDPFVM